MSDTQPESKGDDVGSSSTQSSRLLGVCRYGNAWILLLLAIFFFLLPGASVIRNLSDANIRSAGIPQMAWRLHRQLTPKYEQWARARLASARATQLATTDIAGTEWPLFGSVFYLWATESLQNEWEKDNQASALAPKEYAHAAIENATQLVLDPKQANWVKIHWGENYLKTQNVFYRMLLIAAMTSHARLTGEKAYLPQLKDQVDSLAHELDASPYGLLEDYPSQCYPGDVLTAIAMIHRADKILGTDHSVFVQRAIRGFQGKALDKLGLVPYFAEARLGKAFGPSRGCGNSYVSLFSPEIWPDASRNWYDLYARHFWQDTWTAAGFREFPRDETRYDWYFDVDAGPVLKGYGFAACAFGVGAARVNGRFDHAYPLTTEMLVTSWPLPNGTLLMPKLLSNATDAPLLGEACILYALTRMPVGNARIVTGGTIPGFTVFLLALQIGTGMGLVMVAVHRLRHVRTWSQIRQAPALRVQFGIWLGLVPVGVTALCIGQEVLALVALLLAQLAPVCRKKRAQAQANSESNIEPSFL